MAGNGFSREVFNTREEVVSQDLIRLQALASRDVQDMEGARSRGWDAFSAGGNPPTGTSDLLTANGSPISAVGKAPTLTFSSGFDMTLGAGDGFLFSSTGVTVDDSPYQVLRWPTQTVSFSTPNGANPRIDVVYATIASVATDAAVRNILVDPNARTVAAQSVNKTVNPLSTIGVQAGTPAGTPTIPAVPADSLPLFYVWVPAAAPTAGTFGPCRASWRRATYPLTGMSCVISGMGMKWDLTTDPTTTSSPVVIRGFHRLIIDGEVMEFWCNFDSTSTNPMVTVDSGANPFGSAAPAGNARPYYFYAVGGRNSPFTSHNSFDGVLAPIRIVESTVAPNRMTNRASAAMTVAGVTVPTEATCYIGIGFVESSTTNRVALIMTNDFTLSPTSLENLTVTTSGGGLFKLGPAASAPATATSMMAAIKLQTANTGSPREALVAMDDGTGAAVPFAGAGNAHAGVPQTDINTSNNFAYSQRLFWPDGGVAQFWTQTGVSGDTVTLRVLGYEHRVKGLGINVNT